MKIGNFQQDLKQELSQPSAYLTRSPICLDATGEANRDRVLDIFSGNLPGFFSPNEGELARVDKFNQTVVAGTMAGVKPEVYVGARELTAPLQQRAPLYTVFGATCLLGSHETTAVTTEGQTYNFDGLLIGRTSQVESVSMMENHPYPQESAARIGRTMTAVIEHLQGDNPHAAIRPLIHIPREEYLTTGERMFAHQKIDTNRLKDYWDIIMAKSKNLEALFLSMFERFGVEEPQFIHPLEKTFAGIVPGGLAQRSSTDASLLALHPNSYDTEFSYRSYMDGLHSAHAKGAEAVFVEDSINLGYYNTAMQGQDFSGIVVMPGPLYYCGNGGPATRLSPLLRTEHARAIKPWYH